MGKWTFWRKASEKKSIDLLVAPHVKMPQNSDRAHAYGWFIDMYCGKKVVEYSGALMGFVSKVMYFIDDRVAIIILTNREDRDQFCQLCDAVPPLIYGPKCEILSGSCSQG